MRKMHSLPSWIAAQLMLLLLVGCQTTPPKNSLATHDPSKWNKDIEAFAASDSTNPPPKKAILFVGSSSIRLWNTLQQDFPEKQLINRGFGGSHLADSVHFCERLITQYEPRQVIIYAGGNDINSGKDPDVVFGDFVALVKCIRKDLPRTRIGYISSAPNPARWHEVDKVRRLNEQVRSYCRAHNMDFIDVYSRMIGPDGLPKPDIFVSDRLHMNEKGYAIWREVVGPYLR